MTVRLRVFGGTLKIKRYTDFVLASASWKFQFGTSLAVTASGGENPTAAVQGEGERVEANRAGGVQGKHNEHATLASKQMAEAAHHLFGQWGSFVPSS